MKTKKLLLLLASSLLLAGCSDSHPSSSSSEVSSESSTSSKKESTSSSSSSSSKESQSSTDKSESKSESSQEKTALSATTLSIDTETETLSWVAVSNADQYEVYDGTNKIATISELTYQLAIVDVNEHSYSVIAKNSSGSYLDSPASNVVKFTATVSKLPTPVIGDDGSLTNIHSKADNIKLDIQGGAREFDLGKTATSVDPSKYGKVVKYKVQATASTDTPRYQDSDWSESKTYVASIADSDIKTGANYSLTDGALPDWYVADEVKRGTYSEGVGIEYGAAHYQAREITAATSSMTISARNFRGEDSKMQVYVNATLLEDANGNDTVSIQSDEYLTFSYDLSSYVGQKVWVWFVGLTNSSTCVNKVSFKSNVTTADSDKFVGSTYGNDGAANTAWTSELDKDGSVYEWSNQATVASEGLKLHENYQGFVSTKVTVDSASSTWKVDLRSFGDRNSQFYFYVDETKVVPTISACQKAEDAELKATVDEDGKVHVNDGWTTISFGLDSYIGQVVTLKVEIVAGGDAMVGGFYFANDKLTTASTGKFIGSVSKNDENAKNAWTAYAENPTGVYAYHRSNFDVRNEGLDFHVNNADSLSVNEVQVVSSNTVWTIDLRGHGNGAKYSLTVNDVAVTPTIAEGDPATLDGTTLVANAGWSVVTYDLVDYVDQTVSVKIEITAGGDGMVGGFYFASSSAE